VYKLMEHLRYIQLRLVNIDLMTVGNEVQFEN